MPHGCIKHIFLIHSASRFCNIVSASRFVRVSGIVSTGAHTRFAVWVVEMVAHVSFFALGEASDCCQMFANCHVGG